MRKDEDEEEAERKMSGSGVGTRQSISQDEERTETCEASEVVAERVRSRVE